MRERHQFRFVATLLFVIGPAMIVVGLYNGRVLLFIGGVLVVACAVFGVWGRKR